MSSLLSVKFSTRKSLTTVSTASWFRCCGISGFSIPVYQVFTPTKNGSLGLGCLRMDELVNLSLSWLKAKTTSFCFRALGLPFNMDVMKAASELKFLMKKSIKVGWTQQTETPPDLGALSNTLYLFLIYFNFLKNVFFHIFGKDWDVV